MSSTSDSRKTFKIVDSDVLSGYVLRSGFDRNPYEISSFSKNMWQPTDVIIVRGASPAVLPVVNPRHKITFAYFAPEVDGVRVPALAGTTHQRTKVERTIKEWERYAHVSFVSAPVAEAKIRISFDPAEGNWSQIGTEHESVGGILVDGQTMNLGGLRTVGDFANDYERHVILHEFGHSLGLLHEHQSPAREGVITMDASCQRYIQRGWTEQMVQGNLASQDTVDRITSYSKLDLNSVMTYATSGRADIFPELKHELSDMDKAYMVINYPRTGDRKNNVYPREGGAAVEKDDRAWTMGHALDTAGLTAADWPLKREEILSRYATLDAAKTLEIREIFGNWTKARREVERIARAARKVANDAKAVADAAEAAALGFATPAADLAKAAQEVADAAEEAADATEEAADDTEESESADDT